jgi:hypothetical protein
MMKGSRFVCRPYKVLDYQKLPINLHFIIGKSVFQENFSSSKQDADPIIVHPEIRKNLLYIKSINGAVRGLTLLAGNHFDKY